MPILIDLLKHLGHPYLQTLFHLLYFEIEPRLFLGVWPTVPLAHSRYTLDAQAKGNLPLLVHDVSPLLLNILQELLDLLLFLIDS